MKSRKKLNVPKTFVLSIVLAVVVWVLVGIIENPDIQTTVRNLSIEYTGTDTLADKGLIITEKPKRSNSSVVIVGKRRDLIEYSGQVDMEIDLSEISAPGSIEMTGKIRMPNSLLSIKHNRSSTVTVTVENLITKEIPVKVAQHRSPDSIFIQPVLLNDTIEIRGAESEVNNIEEALAEVDITADDTTMRIPAKQISLSAKSGVKADVGSTIEILTEYIEIENTFYEKKELPVRVILDDTLSDKLLIDEQKCVIEPQTIEAGVSHDSNIDCVYVQVSSADEAELKILPQKGLYIPDGNDTVHVTPFLLEKSMPVNVFIKAVNVRSGLNASYQNTLTGLLVTASPQIIEDGTITATADCSQLDEGVYQLQLTPDDENVTFDKPNYITIELSS